MEVCFSKFITKYFHSFLIIVKNFASHPHFLTSGFDKF